MKLSRHVGYLAVSAATSLVLCAAAQAATQLRSLALSSSADTATLELTVTGPASAHNFTLSSPFRLVVDLPDAELARGLRLPPAAAPILALRAGRRPNGTLRLVLDLSPGTQTSVTEQSGDVGARVIRITAGTTRAIAAAVVRPAPSQAPVAAVPVAIHAAHAPAVGDRDIVIAVDAGHGGDDPGASGRNGTQEKNVTLAIARALAERIDRDPGMRAVLTRSSDVLVPLRDRIDRAHRARADLFVSIHADAVRDRDVEGASVYVLSERGATSEAARSLADRENAADLKGVALDTVNISVASVLIDLSQSASIGNSAEVAGRVLGALDVVGAVRKREVQRAGFVVLKSTDTPSMLIETAYISNPAEERKLRSASYQRQLAEAISSGIAEYFRAYPPDGTLYAQQRRESAGGDGATLARSSP